MIIGIGNDCIDIFRIEKMLDIYGSRFTSKVFTEAERNKAESRGNAKLGEASTYAKRWAAKEACSKALGTGIAEGITWQDIEIVNLASGKPVINLYNKAKERLSTLTPQGYIARVDVTLTDDYPKASAVVIISAEKE